MKILYWIHKQIRRLARLVRVVHLDELGGAIGIRHKMKNLSRGDLEDIIVSYHMQKGVDWFAPYLVEERERRRLELIVRNEWHTDRDWNRGKHMADLETKVKQQAREITAMREKAEVFNRQLYATGLIVHCTGCDAGQPFDGENLTEDRVQEVERIAARLRTWYENHQHRIKQRSIGDGVK